MMRARPEGHSRQAYFIFGDGEWWQEPLASRVFDNGLAMTRRESPPTAAVVVAALKKQRDTRKAAFLQHFFRTGPGGYGEGDRFLGVTVPVQRRIARLHRVLPREGIARLLANPYHEVRFVGVAILADQFKKASPEEREPIVTFYLEHRQALNSWDLIDVSAPHILGEHLAARRETRPLFELAASPRLWDRRMAMLASWAFIRRGNTRVATRIAERLVTDEHDLIHKAVGWMLREVGKRDESALLAFLDRHARSMPRTMLRYATEKLTEPQRSQYMVLRQVIPRRARAAAAPAPLQRRRRSGASRAARSR
jgi:3-methyladenine DNA glycosylase AlkD